MTRVVCPVCRTGFEANISSSDFAVNCVACGVAFNAAMFLSKEDFSARGERRASKTSGNERGTVALGNEIRMADAPTFSEPASTSTRTGGLPFEDPPQVKPAPKTENGFGPSKDEMPMKDLYAKLNDIRRSLQEKNGATAPAAPGISAAAVVAAAPAPAQAPAAAAVAVAPAAPVAQIRKEDKSPTQSYARIQVPVAASPVPVVPSAAPVPAAAPAAPAAPAADAKKKAGRRPLLEGTFGPFDIEGEIARGGVGAVFRARERDTGREVALKVLLEGPEAGEAERERFQHECETAKALSLPGMVQVYAVGECDGRPYMAMELVNGRSLDRVIPEKSLSVNDCLVLMKSVAETIGALHEAGYVHRDLKPGNILIDSFGSPKVADFGLVKSLDEITRLTASGLVCGTPAYMAPEQARGDGKAVDPRSDVWALGAVLYEMLTARPPFQAENALRLMLKITKEQPKPPRMLNMKVPQDVHYIVMKCLEKNADKRYPNARLLAADITKFLNGEPLEASSNPHEKVQKIFAHAAQNKRSLLTIGGAVAAIFVVGILARTLLAPADASTIVDRGYRALSDTSISDADRLDTAEKSFREALTLDPKNAKASLGLGLCLGRRGIDKAGRVDQKLVAEAMSATNQAAVLDPQLRAECHAQVARFNLWMKQFVDEAHELERAVQLAPHNLRYREALAMSYWNVGAQLNAPRYYKSAVAEFQYILSVDPEYPNVRRHIKNLQEKFLAQQTQPVTAVANRGRL